MVEEGTDIMLESKKAFVQAVCLVLKHLSQVCESFISTAHPYLIANTGPLFIVRIGRNFRPISNAHSRTVYTGSGCV